MATFTKTISNDIRCFGQGPSTKWGQDSSFTTMVWGSSQWGEGETLPLRFIKVISNSQSFTFDYTGCQLQKPVSIGSFEASFSGQSFTLQNGGWYYVFTSDTTIGSGRDVASWSSSSFGDVTYTCQAAQGNSWSEV